MRAYPEYSPVDARWFDSLPKTWDAIRAKWIFTNEKQRAKESDEQLAASQKYGVVPQKLMIDLNNANVMLALKGTENFKVVKRNDFVISLRSFEGGIEHSDYNGCISPAYTVLRIRNRCIEPSYFRYALKCLPFIKALNSTSEGIRDGKTITYDEFGQLLVALPPQTDQQAIANYLDRETARIDNLIAEKQDFINLLKEKRQALISHVVTKGLDPNVRMKDSGMKWIGDVPEHWMQRAFKRDWSVNDCKHITAEFVESGIPLASIREVQSTYIDLSGAKQTTNEFYNLLIDGGREPQAGDLIFSRNATVGEVAIVPDEFPPFAMGQDVCLLRKIAGYDSKFMYYQLRSNTIKQQLEVLMVGATFRRINVDDIRNFTIFSPPLDEQAKIAAYLDSHTTRIDALIEETDKSIVLINEHRTALISAAVTGKIDVRHHMEVPA